ncbi:MAG: hypothetical protein EHM70_14265 [Chloroflexota bacterium]|nr:MAG: hypothetical protein EHM70_14265 [Chloroflexota bacterium]
MHHSFTFARISGIPLKLHFNWFIVAALVTWSLSVGYFPQQYPGWDKAIYWAVGMITSLLFFASVLAHELGHALVAIGEGVPVKSITLFIFGGVAHIGNEPPTADSDFRIVVSGPFSSLVLAAIFYTVGHAAALNPQVSAASNYLSYMNLVLALFNLIPGFPLDGGRILRAILWKAKNSFQWATRWATNVGLMIAFLFVLLGIAFMFWDSIISGIWMAFIGVYLASAARQSYRQSVSNEGFGEELAPTAELERNFLPVTPVMRKPSQAYGASFIWVGMNDNEEKRHTGREGQGFGKEKE